MQPKLLKLGSALTVAAAFLNATTAPAAAGGYYDTAAQINHYIQSAPWTGYGSGYGHGSGYGYGGGYGSGYGSKSWDTTPRWSDSVSYGWTPHYGRPYTDWAKSYISTLGHGTVTYYDHYGDHVYYGEPAYAKRTTIVHPTVQYDGYGHVEHDAYGDGHVMHVGKHATDLRNPIFFASGSSALSYEAKHELKQIGQIISAYYFDHPKVLILLSGFTDAAGSKSANEALAKARNHAVMSYLIQEFGFDKARFVLRAVGEDYANMSAMPYDGNQRKVTVSLIGLPKSVTDHGHQGHTPAMADGHEMDGHEMTGPALDPALDKGELAPAGAHAMAQPQPAMKPMPKPAQPEHMQPEYRQAGHMQGGQMQGGHMQGGQMEAGQMHTAYVTSVPRCIVPSGPYGGPYVDGKLLATLFTSIDDYGGGKLEEVCGLRY